MIGESVLHSVSYSGSWGQQAMTVEQFVDKAADLGFGGVMLMAKRPHLSVLDWDSAARSRLRAQIERRGLRMSIIAGYTNFTADLEHRDIPHREFQIRHVTELAAMARDLGGSAVRIFTGYEHPTASRTEQWNLIVAALRECADRAAEFGVTIGVQNHHDIACDYLTHHDLIEEVNHPNCRAIFDAWAPALQGTDLFEAASKMAPVTVFTTAANYQMRPRFCYRPDLVNFEKLLPEVRAVPIDQGFIDYAAFLKAMEAGGYAGPVAYEMCSPLKGGGTMANLDRCAKLFLDFLARYHSATEPSS